MKKSSLGAKITTVIQFVLCLIFAFAIWISVQYGEKYSGNNSQTAGDSTSESSDAA